ncbi:MAG: TetR/AcrR family transcriptional regulator, partial [Clostridia bacterium]|nr:TetR/AcrR family transcriptional regulator [Clostridia bacterium]
MAESAQSRQSREWIATALTELMEKQPYAQITISEITRRAGVARLTFYRHYATKEEVLEDRLARIFEEYEAEVNACKSMTMREALALCFSFWATYAGDIRLLKVNGLDRLLYAPFTAYLEEMLSKWHVGEAMQALQKQFLVGGLYFAMLEHILSPGICSAEEAADQVLELLRLPDA